MSRSSLAGVLDGAAHTSLPLPASGEQSDKGSASFRSSIVGAPGSRRRRVVFDLGFAVLALVLLLASARVHSGFVQDDAYITYRYARNIASGAGFVYNGGEAVLGTSTPLYALSLALLSKVTGLAVPDAGILAWLAGLWVAGIALYRAGLAAGRVFAALVALLFLTSPLLSHMVGMESAFVLALLALATWALSRDRLFLASVLIGALILTRFEMVLFAVVAAAYQWFAFRRSPVWLAPAVVILSFWLAYAFLVFGSPIPLSATAKLVTAREPFAVGFLFYMYLTRSAIGWVVVHTFTFLVGAFFLVYRRDAPAPYALLLLWGAAYFAVAAAVAGSFPWYYAPLLPAVAIATTYGARYISSVPIARRSGQPLADGRPGSHPALFLLIGLLLLLGNLASWARDWADYGGGIRDHRFVAYRDISAWLLEHMDPGDSLAAAEIGYIGYFTDVRVLDLYGLVTPGVHPWLPLGLEATTSLAIEAYAPDYVLIEASGALSEALGASSGYTLAATFEGNYELYARESPSE
jgi:hypothetical protein